MNADRAGSISSYEPPIVVRLRAERDHWCEEWHREREWREGLQKSLEAAPYPSDVISTQIEADDLRESLRQLVQAVEEERRWSTGSRKHQKARDILYSLTERLHEGHALVIDATADAGR